MLPYCYSFGTMARKKRRAPKGSGQRPFLAGRTWAFRYTEHGRRKYAGGYETEAKAVEALAVITADVRAGKPGVPEKQRGPSALVREVVEDWWESRAKLRNLKDDKARWKLHLADLVEHRHIDAIDPELVSELKIGLEQDLDPASVERVLYLLSAFYRWARRHPKKTGARTNPVADYLASLSHAERKEIRSKHDPSDTPFLVREDIARVFGKLPEPVSIAYALSALAGLRPGEALALRWADVDLEARRLRVRRRVRHGAEVDTTKGGKPRTVPIVLGLLDVLKDWRGRSKGDGLVAPGRGGEHLGTKTVATALDEALAKLGLPAITFYEAGRHSFASNWAARGQDIYRLSKILGHANVTTTMRYSHTGDDHPDEVLTAIDVALVMREAAQVDAHDGPYFSSV